MKAPDITTRLEEITAAIAALEAQGIEHGRLELVAPGGTAGEPSKRTPKYGRLRRGSGANRTSTYLPLEAIASTQAAIARGRQVKVLRREAVKLQAKVERSQGVRCVSTLA